jgi:hypothetical protein
MDRDIATGNTRDSMSKHHKTVLARPFFFVWWGCHLRGNSATCGAIIYLSLKLKKKVLVLLPSSSHTDSIHVMTNSLLFSTFIELLTNPSRRRKSR